MTFTSALRLRLQRLAYALECLDKRNALAAETLTQARHVIERLRFEQRRLSK